MALLVMVVVSAAAARGEEGCTKDTDCKGERICVQRLCVAPATQAALPPPVPAGDAAPATFRGPVTPGPLTEPPTLATTPMGLSDTRHRHLGGFIRPDLGIGYLTTSASQGGVDHWGLGVAGHLSMSLNEDSGSNAPIWTTWAFTVAFSATYN